jgi:hypothetical protein
MNIMGSFLWDTVEVHQHRVVRQRAVTGKELSKCIRRSQIPPDEGERRELVMDSDRAEDVGVV